MKKILLLGLMGTGIFSAVKAMDLPYVAPIINRLTDEDVQIKFEFASEGNKQSSETIELPARHETKFEFDRNKNRVFPKTVTVTIRDPKTVSQKVKHKISGSTVTKNLGNYCFQQIEILPSALSTTGFEVKIKECAVHKQSSAHSGFSGGGSTLH